MHKKYLVTRLCPGYRESLQHSLRTPSWIQEGRFVVRKDREGTEGGRERGIIPCQKFLDPPLH